MGAVMDTYRATGLAEGFIEPDHEDEVTEAWQFLIDTGVCWQFQGWFGRTAMNMIEAGVCSPPPTETRH